MFATLRSRPPPPLQAAPALSAARRFFRASRSTASRPTARFPTRHPPPLSPSRTSSLFSPSSRPNRAKWASSPQPCISFIHVPGRLYHHRGPEPSPPQPPPLEIHKPPQVDPRNPYGYRPYNNEHYIRLQSARPLPTPSGLSITAVVSIAVISALVFYFSNLETVPVSGRTRFNVYSKESVAKISEMELKRLVASLEEQGAVTLGELDPRTRLVAKVMRRLIPFSGMQDEGWEIFVIDDPRQANAFVLPGGKVFVFTGILSLARNESAVAAVLGHEIAHNLAEHVGERLSADIGTNIVMVSLLVLGGVIGLGPLIWWFAGNRFMDVAFGYPMSRMQESEADYIGLMMMAEACYDPQEALRFWTRMEMAGAGNGPIPEWGSTHPSNATRIKKIKEWLPEAMKKREESDCYATPGGGGMGSFAEAFRRALAQGHVVVVPA